MFRKTFKLIKIQGFLEETVIFKNVCSHMHQILDKSFYRPHSWYIYKRIYSLCREKKASNLIYFYKSFFGQSGFPVWMQKKNVIN